MSIVFDVNWTICLRKISNYFTPIHFECFQAIIRISTKWNTEQVVIDDENRKILTNILRIIVKMQTQVAIGKKLGHIRRPSYGKATPISSILFNLSSSSDIRHDGIASDASTSPSHVFSFGSNGPVLQHRRSSNDMADVTVDFIEHEKLVEQNEKIDPKPEAIDPVDFRESFLKCVNYHHVDDERSGARDVDDIDDNLPKSRDKPCLICNAKTTQTNDDESIAIPGVNQSMRRLCETLCNDDCKEHQAASTTPTFETSQKNFVRSNSSRQEFLASMLQEASTHVDAPHAVSVVDNDIATDNIARQTAANVIDHQSERAESYFLDKLTVAEALAKTSMMTSPAVKRRLAARQVEMDLNNGNFAFDDENSDDAPPKELLMYLVR